MKVEMWRSIKLEVVLFSTSKLVLSKVTAVHSCFPNMCVLARMDLKYVTQVRLYYCYLKNLGNHFLGNKF